MQMAVRLASHTESFPASASAWKSMKSLYSGKELAINWPSQLRILPLTGFTVTESFFWRSATFIQ